MKNRDLFRESPAALARANRVAAFEGKRLAGDDARCWLWTDPLNRDGYGRFYWMGSRTMAHRVAWELSFGKVPAGMCVCHKCDVRSCVNPSHLFIGTHLENMRDREKKGRNVVLVGEAHYKAKVTAADVRKIRADKRPLRLIADDFGITKTNVSEIRRRKTWRHVL